MSVELCQRCNRDVTNDVSYELCAECFEALPALTLTEREAFEVAWMRRWDSATPADREYYRGRLGRGEEGTYYDPEVMAAWWAWQERGKERA